MTELESELDCDDTGPRYTSYPGPDRFLTTFDPAAYAKAAVGRTIGNRRPLALHVHLPRCRDLRYNCACHGVLTRNTAETEHYLDYLAIEIALHAELLRADPRAVQMTWSGGTPGHYNAAGLRALFKQLTMHFDFTPGGEYSIEADRALSVEAIRSLGDVGFNGISFPVQSFDPLAEDTGNRLQAETCAQAAIEAARTAGFDTIQVDLTYGLRRQALAGFNRTLSWLTGLRPDRISLYGPPHSCDRFALRPRIGAGDQTAPHEQRKLLELAIEHFGKAGYVHVGLDQFALAGDSFSAAQRHGSLYRCLSGYSTCRADVIGLGMAALGAIGPTYSQNERTLERYYAALRRRELPVARGIVLNADQLLRRAVIEALMCQFAVSKQSLETAYLIDFDRYFAPELERLHAYEALGLLAIEDEWLQVTAEGRFLVPGICSVFDRYAQRPGRAGPAFLPGMARRLRAAVAL